VHLPYYYGVLFVDGGLYQLHSVDEDAVSWLTSYGSRHTYEKKKTGDHQRTQENEESKKVPFKLLCCPKKLQSGKKGGISLTLTFIIVLSLSTIKLDRLLTESRIVSPRTLSHSSFSSSVLHKCTTNALATVNNNDHNSNTKCECTW